MSWKFHEATMLALRERRSTVQIGGIGYMGKKQGQTHQTKRPGCSSYNKPFRFPLPRQPFAGTHSFHVEGAMRRRPRLPCHF